MRTIVSLAISAVIASAAVSAQAGCMRCDPILNISKAPVTTATGNPPTNEQVMAAIIRAGAALGWQMKNEAPGKLVGTLNLRKHTANVEISYSPSDYSITYKDSINLDAGTDGTIHKNYNGWIQNLNRGITAQLSAAGV
jgi:hypothetical protein